MLASVPLEELHGPLVPLRGRERLEGAQVPPLARARVLLARVEAELARLELPDHAAKLPICPVARHRRGAGGSLPPLAPPHPGPRPSETPPPCRTTRPAHLREQCPRRRR